MNVKFKIALKIGIIDQVFLHFTYSTESFFNV